MSLTGCLFGTSLFLGHFSNINKKKTANADASTTGLNKVSLWTASWYIVENVARVEQNEIRTPGRVH